MTEEDKELEDARVIRLPVHDMAMVIGSGGGAIVSGLHQDGETPMLRAAFDALESLILAHAMQHIDVQADAYCDGIEAAVVAITNALLEDKTPTKKRRRRRKKKKTP